MKRLFLFLLFSLFLINSVIALDCQYKVNESYEVEEEWFYFDGDFEGVNLKMGELVNITNNHLSFVVQNNLTIPIKVELNYTLRSTWFGINQPTSVEIDVGPRNSKSYQEERISAGWGSYYWIEKFIPTILTPEISSEWKVVTKQREICKVCGNEVCLNDGASCNPIYDNSKCGSGICNIAGFCGKLKVVDCPNGKLNCQDKVCLESSTKEQGESYMCSFECKSDRFENGTCLKSSLVLQEEEDERNKKLIVFGVIALILLSVGVGYLGVYRWWKVKKLRENEEGKRDKVKEEYENFIVKKEETEKAIKENSQGLEDLKKEREEIERSLVSEKEKSKKNIDEIKIKENEEIKKWEDRRKNKSIEAQKSIDEEIKKIRLARQKEIDFTRKEGEEILKSLNYQVEKNKRLFLEKRDKENELREKNLILDKDVKEINEKSPEIRRKKLENYYNSKYGHRNTKVFYDTERKSFRISYPDGKIYDLYWKIYRDNINSNLSGKHVHHINYDEEIDELWNLTALSEEDHNKIKHYNIEKGDWESGIEEIKRALNWEDSDFPEHIQKEMENREKQRKSEKYAKRSFRRRR